MTTLTGAMIWRPLRAIRPIRPPWPLPPLSNGPSQILSVRRPGNRYWARLILIMDTRSCERSGLGGFERSIPRRSHSLAGSDRGDSRRDSRGSTAAPRGVGRRGGKPHHGVAGSLFWGTNPQLVAAAPRKKPRHLGSGGRYRAREKAGAPAAY